MGAVGVLQYKNLGSPKCISLISAQYMALRGMGSGSSPRTWAAQCVLALFLPNIWHWGYGQWEFSKNLGSPMCISLISAQYMALERYGQWEFSKNLGSPKCIRLISAQYMALRSMGSGSSPRTWAAQSV